MPHMDLKPENILIFDEHPGIVGKWKLCDFGISVLQQGPSPSAYRDNNELNSSSTLRIGSVKDLYLKVMDRTIQTPARQRPATYQAPEVEHGVPPDQHDFASGGRSIDIWSYGTIFAEVLAYASGGSHGVQDFRQRRMAYTTVRGYPHEAGHSYQNMFFYTSLTSRPEAQPEPLRPVPCTLRHEVSVWLDSFKDQTAPSRMNEPCLRCWATCVKHILQVDPHKRPDAKLLLKGWIPLLTHSEKSSHADFDISLPAPDSRRPSAQSVAASSSDIAPDSRRPSVHSLVALSKPESAPREHTVPDLAQPESHSQDASEAIGRPSVSPSSISEMRLLQTDDLLSRVLGSSTIVDHDTDGSGKLLAYLTKIQIVVVHLDGDVILTPKNPRIALPTKRWIGIKVVTPFVAVWGTNPTRDRPTVSTYYLARRKNHRLTSKRLLSTV